ncbi:hypothetical protein Tco_0544018 [Tanacetum coccineum]
MNNKFPPPHFFLSDESEEKEAKKAEQPPATSQEVPEDTSVLHPSSLKSTQIQELMAQVHLLQSRKKELEHQKAAAEAEAEVASLKAKPLYPDINQLTTLLLPFKVIELSEEIKELKQHVKDMELELHGDLQEIPSKLETFTSTISSLSS